MKLDDQLEVFLARIDEYLKNKDLAPPVHLGEYREGEDLTMEQIRDLEQDECFSLALGLAAYLDHVISQRTKQENVVKFCDHHLSRIVAKGYKEVETVYGPYETKEQIIIRENDVAIKLTEFRLVAEGRVNTLKSREYNLRKKIDLLNEKGKRL